MKLLPKAPPAPLPDEIERAHLLSRLRADNTSLVVLQAPIGFGKQTLAAQYVRQSPRPCLWLDLKDAEMRGAYLAHLVVDSQLRQVGLPFPAVPEATYTELTDLLADSIAAGGRGLNLVLTHTRGLDREGFAWINDLAEQQWPEVQILVCGYDFPHLLLHTLIHRRTATLLNETDLGFSPEELARLGVGAELTAVATWPSATLAHLGGEHQMTGLLSEMMSGLPPAWRGPLAELSVLETWTEAHAAQLGIELPLGWLRQLVGLGFPLSEAQNGALRPHPYFLTMLRASLQLDPQRFTAGFSRAAKLYERQDQFDEAIRAYLHFGDVDAATTLARRLITRWERSWEPQRIAQILQQFKIDTLPGDLASALALALVDSGRRLAGEALLSQQQRQPQSLYALSVAAARRGDYAGQVRLAEEGLTLDAEPAITQRLRRARANGLLGLGQYDLALAATNLLLEQQKDAGDATELCSLLLIKETVQAASGQYVEREVTLGQALAIASDLKLCNHEDAIRIYQAENQLLLGDPTGALGAAEHLRQILQHRSGLLLPFALEVKGEVQRVLGQLEDALDSLRQALAVSQRLRIDGLHPRLHARQAELLAQLGFTDEASVSMTIARAAGSELLSAPQSSILTFYGGICSFWSEEPVAAEAQLAAVLASPAVEHRFAARARLYLGKLLRDLGRPAHSQDVLGALPNGILKTLALHEQAWLGASAEPITASPTGEEPRPSALLLDIRTVGKYSVSIGDLPVRVSSIKTRELLTFLGLYGDCSREALVEALWEGNNEKRHIDHLKLLIRRLRGSLSIHPGVTFNPIPYTDGYYALAKEFEIHLDVAHLLAAGDELTSGVAEHADLVIASFLQGTYTEWSHELRRQFTERSLEALLALARRHEHQVPLVAAQYYRRAINLDPLLEQPYQLLIDLLLTVGERAAAETTYRLYAKMLQEEFGSEPPAELKAQLARVAKLL